MVVWGLPHVRVGHRQTIKYRPRPQGWGFFIAVILLLLLLLLLLLFVERMISDDEVISCRANGYDELISNQNLNFSLIN